jgi:hypothetical protein
LVRPISYPMIAATQLPLGSREPSMGFNSEVSLPRRREIFFTATRRDFSPMDTAGTY